MKYEHKVIVFAAIFGFFVSLVYGILEYLFFYEGLSLMEVLFTDVSSNEVYMRVVFVGSFVVFGVIISRVLSERERAVEERGDLFKELKVKNRELEESNKLKDLFTDIMRHDLLNPASAARGMSKMALDEEDDPRKREVLQIVLDSNRRVIDMIEAASVVAAFESDEKIELKERDLGHVLRIVAREMRPLANSRGARISLDLRGEYLAMTNPLVYDVFSNLLSNAIKYSPEGSEVVVSIVRDGFDWKVSVSDRGEGIPDEFKESVFDRFMRVKKGGVRGTGLGLTIVKRVVDALGGRVWVEDNPSGGSIFFVTLPKKIR